MKSLEKKANLRCPSGHTTDNWFDLLTAQLQRLQTLPDAIDGSMNCWWHCFIKLRVYSLAEGDVSLGVILEVSKASPHQHFTLSFVIAVQDVNSSCFSTRHFLPGFPLMVEVDFIPLERDTQKKSFLL